MSKNLNITKLTRFFASTGYQSVFQAKEEIFDRELTMEA